VQLKAEGWHLQEQELRELAEEYECSLEDVLRSVADQDLRRVGLPCLPEDVNRAASSTITGPVVVQVSAIRDVSKASTSLSAAGGRMLMLKLTDGKVGSATVYKLSSGFLRRKVPLRNGRHLQQLGTTARSDYFPAGVMQGC
jgi:hypothetical protein